MDGILTTSSAKAAAEVWLGDFGAALASGEARAYRGAVRRRMPLARHPRLHLGPAHDLRRRKQSRSAWRRRWRTWRRAGSRWPPAAPRHGGSCARASIRSRRSSASKPRSVPATASCAWSPKAAQPRAWTLMTALDEIRGHEDPANGRRWQDVDWKRNFGGENWLDRRKRAQAYADRDPAVLVVGAAQAGLSIAARLTLLGVDTLVVDREARIGDSWRRRYHALTLHNETRVNHLPYMPFPRSWPVFIPKDMLANWFEIYAEAMELNVWTQTELASGTWDEAAGCWDVELRRGDGTERRMRPRHIVFANGVSTTPIMPDLPGLNGVPWHGAAFRPITAAGWTGRASARWCWAPAPRGTTLPRICASPARPR